MGFTFFSVYRWARLVIYFSAARFGASDSIDAKSGRAVSRCVLGYAGSQRGRLYWCLWGGGQGLAAVTAPCGYTQDTRKTHARHTQDTRKTHARRPLFVAK